MKFLNRLGAENIIVNIFPGMTTTPDPGYNFALEFNCDSISDKGTFVVNISNIRRHILGTPFQIAFTALLDKTISSVDLMEIPYRKSESFYVCPIAGKVVVIFLVDFADPTDKALGRVFLQQFVEAQNSIRNAPPVSFSRDPPGELSKIQVHDYQSCCGFISFAFEERHVAGSKKDVAITMLTGFRSYLHYHIKCSKTHLNMRMRKQVSAWMQVLNRARPDVEQEKKTATGKTFTRK